MGGLGKTTLVQHVYNDEKLHERFQVKAWVCVSEDFNISRLIKEIIESATTHTSDLSSIAAMQCSLQQILNAKRFLIVLDDVWTTNLSGWDALQCPFSYGAKGSKIIVTTRDEAVSRAMGTDHPYRLKFLLEEHCLDLFLQHAFVGEDCTAHPDLMEIGKDLVKSHCHGLPLAAKVLGGLLSSKERDTNIWRSILNSQLWSSNEGEIEVVVGENEVMKVLRMSYHHLQPHIKQCFAYCSIFPEDYLFEKDELVRLWMAQGFIQSREGRTEEETGSDYFDSLLSRSFFQEDHHRPWLEIQLYKMHDCILHLAKLVSSDECFRFGSKPNRNLASHCYHHAPMVGDGDIVNLNNLYYCKGIRTVIIGRSRHFTNQSLNDLIVNLKYLRVLVLKGSMITEVPDSISNLKHLRGFDISRTEIRQLPESMSSLYHLQTLNLELSHLRQLPKETRKLVNLRHLDLTRCRYLESMLPDMGTSTNLQTLSQFIVGKERGCGIGELKGLNALKGEFVIKNLHNVSNAKEAEEANLKDKNIESLWLEYDTDVQHEESEKILEALQPPTSIKSLDINGYSGKNFPSWFRSLTSLEPLVIKNCRQLSSLEGLPTSLDWLWIVHCPQLSLLEGLPTSLDGLLIYNCPQLSSLEGLPTSLDRLSIAYCPQLSSLEGLPTSLDPLSIANCPQLSSLEGLPTSLDRLAIANCPQLSSLEGLPTSLNRIRTDNCPKLRKRYGKKDGEDWPEISHIHDVEIY